LQDEPTIAWFQWLSHRTPSENHLLSRIMLLLEGLE